MAYLRGKLKDTQGDSQLTHSVNNISWCSLFVTPKFCISIFFSFAWGFKWPQEKLKTMLLQDFRNFGVTNKEHYGMLLYFLEWSIWSHVVPCRPVINEQHKQYEEINMLICFLPFGRISVKIHNKGSGSCKCGFRRAGFSDCLRRHLGW